MIDAHALSRLLAAFFQNGGIDPTSTVVQELLKKEVLGIEDLTRILGKRPFTTRELQNIDRFRSDLREFGKRVVPPGIWEWIESFRSPGLAVVRDAGDDGDEGNKENDDDRGDNGNDDGENGGGLFWGRIQPRGKYPVAT